MMGRMKAQTSEQEQVRAQWQPSKVKANPHVTSLPAYDIAAMQSRVHALQWAIHQAEATNNIVDASLLHMTSVSTYCT
jgi:hypothetical protein